MYAVNVVVDLHEFGVRRVWQRVNVADLAILKGFASLQERSQQLLTFLLRCPQHYPRHQL